MNKIVKILSFIFFVAIIIAACNKVNDLPVYADGNAPVLTASKTAVSPTIADSSKVALTFTWTNAKYATADLTTKYIVQIDTAGGSFTKPFTKEITGKLSASYTGTELNNILLNYSSVIGAPYKLDVRVISSYANNNERHISNAVSVSVTGFNDPSMLKSSAASVVGTAVTASATALTFTWTPSFKSYTGLVTYSMEYDSMGKNFASSQIYDLAGANPFKNITIGEINETALNEGVTPGSVGKIQYRIKATTVLGAISYSNAVAVSVKTFSPAPPNLYIVGDATPGGWANPVPTPSQQFIKIDANNFTLTINLTAGKSFLLLPVNGDWSHKYGGASDGTATGGGVLLKDGAVPGSNTPSPATSGYYKIDVNFLTSRYTVKPIVVPANLFIVGDATPGGWANPVPVPSQQFTQLDGVSFGIVVNLTAGNSYLFLPVNGDWSHKFGGATNGTAAGGGGLLADGSVPGSNTPAPTTSGLYRIVVNFGTNTYTVTPVPANLFIVGDATPGGWANPVPVPSQQFTQPSAGLFQISLPLTSGNSYLLLPVNGDWSHKYGGATDGVSADGDLLADGDVPGSNTPAPSTSGSRTITVNFTTMKYKVQ